MSSDDALPPIPPKRYFTIGEVSELCGVKPHVLRYWEQEFTQLRPMKRRGNRRYYQHHEVLMIRRIRELLYDEGFTIQGARNRLADWARQQRQQRRPGGDDTLPPADPDDDSATAALADGLDRLAAALRQLPAEAQLALRAELQAIRDLVAEAAADQPPSARGPAVAV
ncbi:MULTISPECIES: MerR family transcriptional regulator [Tepidimonas]|uniref:MerR HTH family regulatory protein n=1 Tax=Tepidimonas aquatica TaxID=247482 RepID=A0A554WK26_9BURK|nr:MerR family transcriptional regulator [Tepidimonas aquatica]TSE23930.1 MerR HTH family regulatory protein [Tepidimonas aquatica]